MSNIEYKNTIDFFDGLTLLKQRTTNIIRTIKSFSESSPEYFACVDFDSLPNIGLTLNNTIVNIGSFYKKHNLSFYNQSPLSHIILCDLCSYVLAAFNELDICLKATHNLTLQKPLSNSQKAKEPLKIKNIPHRIKNFSSEKDMLLIENYKLRINEAKKFTTAFTKYHSIDEALYNYDLTRQFAK